MSSIIINNNWNYPKTFNYRHMISLIALSTKTNSIQGDQRKFTFSIATEKVELMHKCFPKYLCKETARMKEDKETEEGKQQRINIESPKAWL